MRDNRIVHVIDDDEAVRDSLSFLLGSARLEVITYESATAFLKALPAIKCGCVVTDVRMPEITGIELLRELKRFDTALPVIVMTGHGDISLAVEAMKEGAVDFLEKPYDDTVLLKAVEAALERYTQNAERENERTAVRECFNSLSQREREVLQGLVAGHANKIIAADLKISPRTVEIYRAHVMTKMRAKSLSDLVRMSLTAKLFGD